MEEIYLMPGEWKVAASPACFTTLLGSCVAVCLWDAQRQIGGMNHFLLPINPHTNQNVGRYGDTATRAMIHRLRQYGCSPESLHAKVFGGAHFRHSFYRVGSENIKYTLALLHETGIRIMAKDIGGSSGRKIKFYTQSGRAYTRPVRKITR